MRCPRCGHEDDKVIDSRAVREGRAVRRRRECIDCGERFTTYEAIDALTVMVLKRDGRRVPYDRSKLRLGIAKACEKRPVTLEQIETIIEGIEFDIASGGAREVSSESIGRAVMTRLRAVDDVAYVRFASVYQSFSSLEEFLDALRSLQAEKDEEEDR